MAVPLAVGGIELVMRHGIDAPQHGLKGINE